MPTQVEVNGRELHGAKKWVAAIAIIAALLVAYAIISAPAWFLALTF